MAGRGELRGSPRERALAGFAALLTEAPWAVTAADFARLREVGLSEEGLEQAICVASFFNYFTRVADGTGVEFDYASPLPRIAVDQTREALPRPPREAWNPAIDGSRVPVFPSRMHAQPALERWHDYLLEREAPLSRRDRRVLSRAAAAELCDAGALGFFDEARPVDARERALVAYATKLTRTPWAMSADDVAPLRAAGLSDAAVLDAITLVAHQNTLSRMHHGLAALRG